MGEIEGRARGSGGEGMAAAGRAYTVVTVARPMTPERARRFTRGLKTVIYAEIQRPGVRQPQRTRRR